MKIVYAVATGAILLLGCMHTLATPIFYRGFTEESLWFAGTGLALVFLGLFNWAACHTPTRAALNLCILANALASIYGILIPLLTPEPQAFVAEIAFLGALLGAIVSRRRLP
ncbi:MAG: hypothetical protein ACOYYS_00645 [Chloroflexota bacterium]